MADSAHRSIDYIMDPSPEELQIGTAVCQYSNYTYANEKNLFSEL